MWWKLGLLAAATAALLFCLLAPVATVTVKVDLPPAASGHAATVLPSQVSSVVGAAIWLTGAGTVAIVLAAAGILGWLIVRNHRRSR